MGSDAGNRRSEVSRGVARRAKTGRLRASGFIRTETLSPPVKGDRPRHRARTRARARQLVLNGHPGLRRDPEKALAHATGPGLIFLAGVDKYKEPSTKSVHGAIKEAVGFTGFWRAPEGRFGDKKRTAVIIIYCFLEKYKFSCPIAQGRPPWRGNQRRFMFSGRRPGMKIWA